MLPIVMAGVAALGVLLVFYALAGARPMDPVQARLSQLGSMQARTLEEIELQQPLFERTLRPLATRLSGLAQRFASPSKVSRTEKRLAMAGNPGDLRTIDFLGLKLAVAGLFGAGPFVHDHAPAAGILDAVLDHVEEHPDGIYNPGALIRYLVHQELAEPAEGGGQRCPYCRWTDRRQREESTS